MIYTFVDSPLWYLEWLEKEGWDGEILMDEFRWDEEPPVWTLKRELRFMRTYIVYLSMAKVNPSGSGSSSLINTVEAAFVELTKQLSSACRESPSKVGPVVSLMMEKVKRCKQEIKDAYATFWDQPWESNNPPNLLSVMEFLDSIQANLRDLLGSKSLMIPSMKEKIESLGENLSSIGNFIGVTEKQNVVDQKMGAFLTNVQVVAISAACLSYFCWFDARDESLLRKMSEVMRAISRIKLRSSEDNVLVTNKEDALALDVGLQFRKTMVGDPSEDMEKDYIETSFTYSILGKKLAQDVVIKVNQALFPLVEKIGFIIADINARKQQNHKADPAYTLEDQIKSLREDITCIESDLKDGKLFLAHPENVASDSSSRISSCHVNDITAERIIEVNIHLLDIIDFIKAELFLLELRNNGASLTAQMNDQADNLQDGLQFLRNFVMNPPKKYNEIKELMLLKKSEAVAIETASIIFSMYKSAMKDHMSMESNIMISDVLGKIVLLKEEIEKVYLQVPLSLHSNIPDGLVFISSMLGDVKEMLKIKAHSVNFVKPQIEMLQTKLKSLNSFLNNTAEQHNENEELKDLWTCITDVAYEAEYMIDSSVYGGDPEWYFRLWLPFAMERIELINSKIKGIYDKSISDSGVRNVKNTSSRQSSGEGSWKVAEFVVGLDDEAHFIIDLLTKGESQRLDIVSIVGPLGIGKTALARKVYVNPVLAYHFRVIGWCTLSREYQRRDLFLAILRGIHEGTDSTNDTSNDLADKVHRLLKTRGRYLIVIDNLRHTQAWNDLRQILPDDHNGSRVLLTSQLPLVAFHANPYSEPYVLRLLSSEESWELLKMKIFQGEACPPSLLEIGKEISAKCKGLPLVLVIMAGLLARAEKTPNCWKKIAKDFHSEIFVDLLENICELCYRHLPDHLKSCFLYFGAFPENKEISVPKLLRLWIAEGFLQKNESRSMEDAAQDYLKDLIERNLVIISQRSSSHGIKTCRVNDLFWNLCMKKAKEENFLLPSYWSYLSNPLAFEQRRLCLSIGPEENQFTMPRPSTPCVRCLMFSVSCDEHPKLPQHVSFISRNFKLLRVLDLESVNMGDSFPTGLQLLELLRYLAIRGSIKSVPTSLANLWNLETLIIKGAPGPVALPNSIWNMRKLRHLHIHPHATFDLRDDEFFNSDVPLDNLFSLSTPLILSEKSMENAMRRFSKLRKLKCILVPSWDSHRKCPKFPVLNFLLQLESLNISPFDGKYCRCDFSFPQNLKKLTLSNFALPWSEISKIGKLPNLEILKLGSRAFEGEEWEVKEGEFLQLMYLKLEALDIARWKASSGSFPCLVRLVIHRCGKLEIPSHLLFIQRRG